ncbi:MAG: NAD-dependent epimerase/dehydratase family protein [Bacilli bacterium]|nr:NAD-dependent epimerase/dehydratase family protein [Bacilli bacterium]
MKSVLVTGAAGFIGSYLCKRLLNDNYKVIGIDNMNNYYDVSLKEYRLNELKEYDNFIFINGNIANKELINNLFKEYRPDAVVNLAAQAGVRYSAINPDSYIESNIVGFYNILEGCRNYPVKHLIFASSSSIYGANSKIPFSVDDKADMPVSLYAATKKSDELLAYSYSNLYNIPVTGLRFFTVYGPAGRPDMAYFDFANKFVNREKIKIFNYGNLKRDFTYIDDIIEGIILVINKEVAKDNLYKIYNIGNSKPESLLDFINILQDKLIKYNILPPDFDFDSYKEYMPMQAGDMLETYADIQELERDFNFKPRVTLEEGLDNFIKWYSNYYK